MRTNKVIILCMLLVFDIVAGCLWFLNHNDGKDPDTSTESSVVTNSTSDPEPGDPTTTTTAVSDNETKEIAEVLQSLDVGDAIKYGVIDTDGIEENGDEDITWIVLAKDGDDLLLITEKAIEAMAYYSQSTKVTWEDSSIRTWLNGDFYTHCFDDAQKTFILTTAVTADDNPVSGVDGGKDVEDKVFLLSWQEAETYFANDKDRRCGTTDHVTQKGVRCSGNYGTIWWWLRTPGDISKRASTVDEDGCITGDGTVTSGGGVRPAMWVRTTVAD